MEEADAGAFAAAEVCMWKHICEQGLDVLELPRREGVSGGTRTTSGWLRRKRLTYSSSNAVAELGPMTAVSFSP